MSSLGVAKQWLQSLLSAEPTLLALLGSPVEGYTNAIYGNEAPQGASFPCVIFRFQPGRSVQTVQLSTIVGVPCMFLVEGIIAGRGDGQAAALQDAIHLALQGKSASYQQHKMNCYMVEPWDQPTLERSQPYRRAGGRYMVMARPNLF